MKRIIAIILICLLAANVSGASISYHFCGKLLQYIAFNGKKKKSKCCCGGTQKHKGCCKTEHHKVKVDEGKSLAKYQSLQKQLVVESDLLPSYFSIPATAPAAVSPCPIPLSHAPPPDPPVPLHVLYRCFLI